MDPHSMFWSMTEDYPGVEIDPVGKRRLRTTSRLQDTQS